MSTPSSNPLVQQLQLLLSGYGYNFYSRKNQERSDDLLVRQKVSSLLGDAAQVLTTLEVEYQRRLIPPATRDNPYPPAGAMDRLREITRLRDSIRDLETRVRGLPVPSQDRIWWRFREEEALLNQLLNSDIGLLEQANAVSEQARALTAESWNAGQAAGPLSQAIQQMDHLIRARQQLLLVPT